MKKMILFSLLLSYSLLHAAAEDNLILKVKELLLDSDFKTLSKDFRVVVAPQRNSARLQSKSKDKGLRELLDKKNTKVDFINGRSSRNETAFHALAEGYYGNEVKIAELVFDAGLEHDVFTNDMQNAPIHVAASNMKKDLIDCFLKNGVNPNLVNGRQQTPLHLVVLSDFRFLANTSILHHSEEEIIEVAQLLLQNSADINAKDEEGKTPFEYAIEKGFFKVAQFFLEQDSNVINVREYENRTLLHNAAEKGKLEQVEFLVNSISLINSEDTKGNTPLHLAIKAGKIEIAKKLIQVGAAVNTQDNHKKTPLHSVLCLSTDQLVNEILEKGADTEVKDEEGKTLLNFLIADVFLSQESKQRRIEQLIVDFKAKINIRDNYSRAPLHYAVLNNDLWTVKFLLQHGADANIRNDNDDVPLHYAVLKGYSLITQELLIKGAHVDARNLDGRRPLHIAILKKNKPMIQLLLEHGARITRTVEKIAEENGVLDFVNGGYKELSKSILKRKDREENEQKSALPEKRVRFESPVKPSHPE